MLLLRELEILPMLTIGSAIRVIRNRVRLVILLRIKKFSRVSFLEFHDLNTTKLVCDGDKLLRDVEVAAMVATNLCN